MAEVRVFPIADRDSCSAGSLGEPTCIAYQNVITCRIDHQRRETGKVGIQR